MIFFFSDELLLEAGFLAILVAPLLPGRRKGAKGKPTDLISFWLVRWLLFRYLLTCGLSKLISGDPKWWSLSGMINIIVIYFLPNVSVEKSYYTNFIIKKLF